MCGSMCIV